MENPKLIIANAAAWAAALSVTQIAPGMSAAAMLNNTKSHVCRAVGTTMDIVLTWAAPVQIGGVHLLCNASPLASISLVGHSDVAGTIKVLDTGTKLACPAPARELGHPWTPVTAAGAYAYGGGALAFAWCPNTLVRRLTIKLSDPGSQQGYLEVSSIFTGGAFTLDNGVSFDPGLTPLDSSEPFRTDAGDHRWVNGTKRTGLAMALDYMTERDRRFMWGMLVANGLNKPAVISLYPGDSSPERERDHQMIGVLVKTSAMRRPNFIDHATALEWESI